MSLLVVGSVAFDSVKTPHGEADEALGGAATFFSVAASLLYKPIHLIGVVGDDFPDEIVKLLEKRGIDCRGLEKAKGSTFRWKGRYEGNMNTAVTEETCLNVFGQFQPKVPEEFKKPDYLFLANIDPDIQLDVLRQVKRPRTVAADTMNFWISSKLDSLKKLMAEIDLMVLNEGEAEMLTGKSNLISAAREVIHMGPKVVIIKKGADGAMIVDSSHMAHVPAFPLETVMDPTGAGDSFGGGLMASLAKAETDHTDFPAIRKAVANATVIASFNCESFSIERIKTVTMKEFDERLKILREYSSF
ncbi:TPA: sugar kinase [bacterium]|nr:MAG: sugar kinase [Candidatus Hydrogenedentes bacterium CG1_02_42_14]PIU47630.1 MAG: sugar kinase [Candidatus Hydrogenedentes bacterium CG07_land_8_20_14_0_80_42_17]HBW47682.1 sugar kinase [bacterium]